MTFFFGVRNISLPCPEQNVFLNSFWNILELTYCRSFNDLYYPVPTQPTVARIRFLLLERGEKFPAFHCDKTSDNHFAITRLAIPSAWRYIK